MEEANRYVVVIPPLGANFDPGGGAKFAIYFKN
jgi:hypothetical protein